MKETGKTSKHSKQIYTVLAGSERSFSWWVCAPCQVSYCCLELVRLVYSHLIFIASSFFCLNSCSYKWKLNLKVNFLISETVMFTTYKYLLSKSVQKILAAVLSIFKDLNWKKKSLIFKVRISGFFHYIFSCKMQS